MQPIAYTICLLLIILLVAKVVNLYYTKKSTRKLPKRINSKDLTLNDRLAIYTLARELIAKDRDYSICGAMHWAIYSKYGGNITFEEKFLEVFSELYYVKPSNRISTNSYWWPIKDKQVRLDALDYIINQLETQIKLRDDYKH